MNKTHLLNSAQSAFVAALLVLALGVSTFIAFEPSVGRTATTNDDFTVTQLVTEEISFLAQASNVTMAPGIGGITGGLSSGTTTVRVLTNNTTGYNMTIHFASTTFNPGVAMNGNTQGGSIANYTSVSTDTPDYAFSVSAGAAEFAYTVSASSSADMDQTFLDNGSNTCGTGATDGVGTCWFGPTTSPAFAGERIINTAAATAASGATTSIAFRIQITSNPSPAIPEDTYVATATLTATTN